MSIKQSNTHKYLTINESLLNDWISDYLHDKHVRLCCEAGGVNKCCASSAFSCPNSLIQTPESCAQLQLLEGCAVHCVWWASLIQRDVDALLCWALVHRERSVFGMDTISHHVKEVAPSVMVNKPAPALAFDRYLFQAQCVVHLLCTVSKNHLRSDCNNPFGLSCSRGGKGQRLWRKLTYLSHMHYSLRISTRVSHLSTCRAFEVTL